MRKESKMKALKNAIETRGHFINDEVLKVDAFLNHQIDCSLVDEMGNEFYEHFCKINHIINLN